MGIKRKYIINNSKHQKQNSLDLLQIPHMQINVALHSEGIQVGIAFSSLTSVIPKQYCFSSPFYQNHIWPFKFIHIDAVQMKSYNVFFWSPVICAILVELYQSWKACQRVEEEIWRLIVLHAKPKQTWEILNMVFPALLKTEVEKAIHDVHLRSEHVCFPMENYLQNKCHFYLFLIEGTPDLFLISHNKWFLC